MSQLDQVIGAIDTFYAPTTPPQIRQQTGKYLESFQNTVNEPILNISQHTNPQYRFIGIRMDRLNWTTQ